MKLFISVCTFTLLVACTLADLSEKEEWESYKVEYGKSYTTVEEDQLRMHIYLDNKLTIERHNYKHDNGLETYTMGVNQFTDMTSLEFTRMMNGYTLVNSTSENLFVAPENIEVPETVDWREKGAVTEIKNQGKCGSCWAFSTTGSLEAQTFLKTGKLVSLSEQNLVDCTFWYGNRGCHGGWMDIAFRYIKKNKGIDTEESYKYEGKDGRCRFSATNVGARVTGYKDVKSRDENALKSAVATVGPISVTIDASRQSFQHYKTGVYYEKSCSSTRLSHGVLAIGYGTEDGKDYWLVKNSWGTSWGDKGFIKMTRNKNNHCGIATRASYPLV